MPSSLRGYSIDGAVAVGLACSLGIVFLCDRAPAIAPAAPIASVAEPTPEEPPKPLRLGVTPKQYDDMGKLLGQLGSGFPYRDIRLEDLEDVEKLTQFDVLFLTCGTVPSSWVEGGALGGGDRPGVRRVRIRSDVLDRLREALRTFVGRGGTLYASDWRLNLIRLSFPEFFDGEEPIPGAAQVLTAEVTDPGLRDLLGPSVELKFDLPGWSPARLAGERVTVYLRGSYRDNLSGSTQTAPLLVKAPYEQGTIIFTSFHNEKVNSELETKLLRFLVFAAVTAKETARAQKTMLSGGFRPQKQSLLDASPTKPEVTQVYTQSKRGKLRFALSFNNEGARLKLTVRGPDRKVYEGEGTSTFIVDIPDAAPGPWTYTVTAIKLPHEQFPFSLTIGEN